MRGITAFVLAGGRGKRMDILCHLRPKPALPFAGKLHVVDFTLSNCVHSGITDIAVLVDYQRTYMADYLREWARANGGAAAISVLQPQAGSYTGTANAVCRNLSRLSANHPGSVMILAGDHIYRMDYRRMIAFHEKVKADATVGVIRVPIEEAHRFGTVAVAGDGRIQDFVEKSAHPMGTLASMGIYIFNNNVLVRRLTEDNADVDSIHDFGYSILPRMVHQDRVFAYEFGGYWQDIGTVEAYYQANMELLITHPRFSLDSDWPVLSDHSALPMPQQTKDGKVVNSLISPGCVIKGRVENSVISPGVLIEKQAVVRDSVVMANTVVGYHSVVDRCIMDEGVQVGDFCYIGFGSSLVPGNWDITVLGKDVRVSSHTAVGRKCRVLPKAGPSDFGGGVVPSGTIVRPGAEKYDDSEGTHGKDSG